MNLSSNDKGDVTVISFIFSLILDICARNDQHLAIISISNE